MRKKGLYILVATALLAWSCGKEDFSASDSPRPIVFSMLSLNSTSSTKADTYTYLSSGSTISVAARKSAGSTWSSTDASYVFNTTSHLQNVQTTNATGSCTYSPAAYWSGNSVFRFRAVYPIAPDQVSYSDDLDGNAVISNFTVNASASAQKDLMLSDMVERSLTSVGNPDPVEIVFHHLLCKVKVQIIEDTSKPAANPGNDVFTITGVKLTGMPDKGTYTGAATSGAWNTSSASSLSCVNNTSHIAPNSYNADSDDDGVPDADVWPEGLKLIPQTITNEVSLVLDYQVAHGSAQPSNKSVVIPIPPITWEAGKAYTYQLALDEDMYIYFGNIIVASWGNTQSSGTVIIK